MDAVSGCLLVFLIAAAFAIRLGYVIRRSRKPLTRPAPLATLIISGSGGHTANMLNLLAVLLHTRDRLSPRFYIAAATDNKSLQKAQKLEVDQMQGGATRTSAEFMQIFRSREVGQSYITSVGTTLVATAHALWLMVKIRPHVILCNASSGHILFLFLGITYTCESFELSKII